METVGTFGIARSKRNRTSVLLISTWIVEQSKFSSTGVGHGPTLLVTRKLNGTHLSRGRRLLFSSLYRLVKVFVPTFKRTGLPSEYRSLYNLPSRFIEIVRGLDSFCRGHHLFSVEVLGHVLTGGVGRLLIDRPRHGLHYFYDSDTLGGLT